MEIWEQRLYLCQRCLCLPFGEVSLLDALLYLFFEQLQGFVDPTHGFAQLSVIQRHIPEQSLQESIPILSLLLGAFLDALLEVLVVQVRRVGQREAVECVGLRNEEILPVQFGDAEQGRVGISREQLQIGLVHILADETRVFPVARLLGKRNGNRPTILHDRIHQ